MKEKILKIAQDLKEDIITEEQVSHSLLQLFIMERSTLEMVSYIYGRIE